MYLIYLWIGKILQRSSRLAGNSGAALPGYFIERFYPQFLEQGLHKLPEGVIVISGTNGKTTTTKIIADSLRASGDRVITNMTGSNMTRGLISMLVGKSKLTGRLPYDVAILEVDEAYAAVLAQRLPIRGALVLNVMRDQLDRFGEIDRTAGLLGQLTKKAKKFVVLNQGDERVATMPTGAHAHLTTFAADASLAPRLKTDDNWVGPHKTKKVSAGYMLLESKGSQLKFQFDGETISQKTEFAGVHNHLNLTAAIATIQQIKPKLSLAEICELVARVKPAFGRGEQIDLPSGPVSLLLVKNPSSFVATLAETDLRKFDDTLVIINDAYADSRDVSWLWDVDVSRLSHANRLITGGARGYDMAVRLKYDGQKVVKTLLTETEIVDYLLSQKGSKAVFCTYTAMLSIRKLLVKRGHVRQVI